VVYAVKLVTVIYSFRPSPKCLFFPDTTEAYL